ncbi:phytanoyl-CoA dioxygenase family protein [Pedobacter foliorum]|uniref:phytanoyl-CoA dioxygenase family protein n=1 Tax=Pedobacter foliorum TaxID=2739058 RepID=UPI0015664263|nr:phytanoyl-CoA dioxygenase family protein [Pedobacter foliorum]NRF37218.1 phytanoyl-CoA dioxygenase family protein [Pedobacter foliorum]
MVDVNMYKAQIEEQGFTTITNVFADEQVEEILQLINQSDTSRKTFRKSADLFAIRQFLKEVPAVAHLIFNDEFKTLIKSVFGSRYFVIKSIYFDKPEQSNWFVSYHQDLTISVDKKVELDDYTKWTVKQDQFSVQPPLDILKQIYTVRIHLDDTDENNGALRIVPGSHLKDIYRPEDIDWSKETEHVCGVPKGGVMIMKPLLLHSSSRTTNNNKRRVIHIEFCSQELHPELQWVERIGLY